MSKQIIAIALNSLRANETEIISSEASLDICFITKASFGTAVPIVDLNKPNLKVRIKKNQKIGDAYVKLRQGIKSFYDLTVATGLVSGWYSEDSSGSAIKFSDDRIDNAAAGDSTLAITAKAYSPSFVGSKNDCSIFGFTSNVAADGPILCGIIDQPGAGRDGVAYSSSLFQSIDMIWTSPMFDQTSVGAVIPAVPATLESLDALIRTQLTIALRGGSDLDVSMKDTILSLDSKVNAIKAKTDKIGSVDLVNAGVTSGLAAVGTVLGMSLIAK